MSATTESLREMVIKLNAENQMLLSQVERSTSELLSEMAKVELLMKTLEERKRAFWNLRMRKTKAHREVRSRFKKLVDAVLVNARHGRGKELMPWAKEALGDDYSSFIGQKPVEVSDE